MAKNTAGSENTSHKEERQYIPSAETIALDARDLDGEMLNPGPRYEQPVPEKEKKPEAERIVLNRERITGIPITSNEQYFDEPEEAVMHEGSVSNSDIQRERTAEQQKTVHDEEAEIRQQTERLEQERREAERIRRQREQEERRREWRNRKFHRQNRVMKIMAARSMMYYALTREQAANEEVKSRNAEIESRNAAARKKRTEKEQTGRGAR